MKGLSKPLLLILVLILIVGLIMGALAYKPDINTSTYEELVTINGIGEVLGERVSLYLNQNPNADVEDLLNVKGIGEKRLELIKKEWSD